MYLSGELTRVALLCFTKKLSGFVAGVMIIVGNRTKKVRKTVESGREILIPAVVL